MRKIIALVILVFVLAGLYAGWQILGPEVKNPSEKYLYVPSGATYGQLKDSLKANGFITGFFWFDRVANYTKLPENLKAGRFKVKDKVSIYDLVRKLRLGRQEVGS